MASAGTAQDADTPQLPQSTNPVDALVRHEGCVWGSVTVGLMLAAILRAPLPW